ncbi:hypothetical protein ACUNWD_08780 [Sunxiuqinia sp. A32]|uniref:hypothetical protein n=1 Tax=Sunxiuqinia sp. A32 TaxID=3461496 RepID=UPI0040456AB4
MKKTTKKNLLLLAIVVVVLLSFTNVSVEISNSSSKMVSYSPASVKGVDEFQPTELFDKPYAIVFHGLEGVGNSANNITDYIIDVYVEEETSIGYLVYMPFYKPVSYSSKGNYKWKNPLKVLGHLEDVQECENFELDAELNIFGLCSTKKAKQKIQQMISNSIQNQIRNAIKKKLTLTDKN